jgi:hypothetical protein
MLKTSQYFCFTKPIRKLTPEHLINRKCHFGIGEVLVNFGGRGGTSR